MLSFKTLRLLVLFAASIAFSTTDSPALSQLPRAGGDLQNLPVLVPPPSSPSPDSNTVVPQTIIPNTTAVVKRNPAIICFDDSGTQLNDGDIITIRLNGALVARNVLLVNIPQCYKFNLRPGRNVVTMRAVSVGRVPFATPGVIIPRPEFYDGLNRFGAELSIGQAISFTLAFPRVQYFRSRTPRSADHAADAQRQGFARLGTIDRPGARARRRASLRNSGLPVRAGFDRDEYPPAVFRQNGGRASVRYVPSGDNQRAGTILGNQLRVFSNGDTVELIVSP